MGFIIIGGIKTICCYYMLVFIIKLGRVNLLCFIKVSLDRVTVHPDCWCICLCYLHFAPENPQGDEMYLLVLAHPGYQSHSPESHKIVVVIV